MAISATTDNQQNRTVNSMVGGKTQTAANASNNPPTLQENKWNLQNLPPEGHADVGGYFYKLYEDSLRERNRLGLPEIWHGYYQLFRNRHWQNNISSLLSMNNKGKLSIGLLHANITRTVANITARSPVAEVESADGIEDDSDSILSEKLRMWNSNENQQMGLAKSVLNQEVYGITIEKAVFDSRERECKMIPLDPYSWLPAPGYYEDINDMPYMMHIFPMQVEDVEAMYGVEGVVESNELYSVLGEDRQQSISQSGTRSGSTNYPGNYVPTTHPQSGNELRIKRALVVECWIRDNSTETRMYTEQSEDPETGEPVTIVREKQVPKYPGGIRVVTFTNNGHLVLADQKNPNVNHALPHEMVSNTYLYNRFPFFKTNSYEDTTSVWGYAMADMVGDLNLEIDKLWSSITNYIQMAMYPPLILPQDTKVSKSQIRYLPRLVIQPTSGQTSSYIRWLDMPTPPTWMFEALSTLISFFDRVSQIEDADRGQSPGSVVAASAIQMLQERGAVLIRAKIRAVDSLVRERGRCFISFYQNFGVVPELVKTSKGTKQAIGVNFINRNFLYLVESGSTVAKTSSQIKQEAVELYKMQAIDRQALLKQVNFPGWKQIVERMGESDLQAALNVLVQAGLPQEMGRELYNTLVKDQGGPGDASNQNQPGGGVGEAGAPAESGTPKAEQGGEESEGATK